MNEVGSGGLWGKTPASQQRRQDIIVAAKHIFFDDGYQRASMDRIAEAAGTTKRTVYDHFGSKDALFAAVIDFGCQIFVDRLPRAEDLPSDPAAALKAFTACLSALVNEPDGIRFQRMVMAEAERHPEFGRRLYEVAFLGAERVLRDYLTGRVAVGQLKPHDIDISTRVFMDLATNSDRTRSLLEVRDTDGAQRSAAAIDQVIAMYVATVRLL